MVSSLKERTMTTHTAQPQPTRTANAIEIRRAHERGGTELGWLHSKHSFSFGRYHDPRNMGYRSLRVINDDVVEPGGGFGMHGHDNMEILTWVLDGSLRHADSTGGEGVIRPGELQAMTAGSGIRHSEFNDSDTQPVHLLQIWIEPRPEARNLAPSYAQKPFATGQRRATWQTLASPDGRDGSMSIKQDAILSVTELAPGEKIDAKLAAQRYGYLHVAFGEVRAGDIMVKSGDSLKFAGPATMNIQASADSQVLLFDLD
jgi:redox-sensitive bicupin YhaK (pirin superfamily)